MGEELTRNLPSDGIEQVLILLRGLDEKLIGLDARLTGLEERVERRLMETRPIWEQVLGKLDGVEKRLDGLDQTVDNLGLNMRAGFKRLERQMGEIAKDVIAVRADQSDLERRMDRLEDKLAPEPL